MSGRSEHFFWHRLRWRFRGAWMWPAFVVLTIADGIVLWRLPPFSTGLNVIEGMLLAVFGNLVLIAAFAPWLANRVRSTSQREVLRDRMATGLLVAGLFGCIAAGLAARPTVVVETEAREQNAEAVRAFVTAHGDDELRRNLETANTVRLAEDYFRTCIARDDRERFFCLFVETNRDPPRITRDPSAEPNPYDVP
jgi:hypothetical protein